MVKVGWWGTRNMDAEGLDPLQQAPLLGDARWKWIVKYRSCRVYQTPGQHINLKRLERPLWVNPVNPLRMEDRDGGLWWHQVISFLSLPTILAPFSGAAPPANIMEQHREKSNKVGRFPSYIDLHQELCSFLCFDGLNTTQSSLDPPAVFVRIVNLHAVHRTKQWVFLALWMQGKGTLAGSFKSVKHDMCVSLYSSRKQVQRHSALLRGSLRLYLPTFQHFGPEMNRYPNHRDPMITNWSRKVGKVCLKGKLWLEFLRAKDLEKSSWCVHKLFGERDELHCSSKYYIMKLSTMKQGNMVSTCSCAIVHLIRRLT